MQTFCKFIKEGLLERELTGTRIIKSMKIQWNVHHKQLSTVGGVRALVITINYSNLASTCKVQLVRLDIKEMPYDYFYAKKVLFVI